METGNIQSNQNVGVQEQMIEYMQKKYNDSFTYVDSFDGGFDKDKKDIVVSSEKVPGDIYVGYRNENGVERYSDNYTQLRFEAETKNVVETLLGEVIEAEMIVTHQIKRSYNHFSGSTTLEEFLKSDAANVCFYAVVSPEYEMADLEELTEMVKAKFGERFSDCSVNIYFANTAEEYMSFNDIPAWKRDEMKAIVIRIG